MIPRPNTTQIPIEVLEAVNKLGLEEVRLLLAIARSQPVAPAELARTTHLSHTSVAAGLSRLTGQDLIVGAGDRGYALNYGEPSASTRKPWGDPQEAIADRIDLGRAQQYARGNQKAPEVKATPLVGHQREWLKIYNEHKPENWPSCYWNAARERLWHEYQKEAGASAIERLKLALVGMKANPVWYITPTKRGSFCRQRTLNTLLLPRLSDGDRPITLLAELAESQGLTADMTPDELAEKRSPGQSEFEKALEERGL